MTEPLSRREFAGLVAASTLLAQSTPSDAMSAQPPAAAPVSPRSSVELLVELVQQTYPDARLDDAAIDEIASDFRHYLSRSRVLSSFPLQNSDEPGFVFAAWRADQSD